MGNNVLGSPRVHGERKYIISRQSKCDVDGDEREKLMHREFTAHKHQIFFIKDRVDKGEISIEYCPTYLMIADFFTKPLQGRMFHLFRNVIMGYAPLSTLTSLIPIKERVGMNKMQEKHKNMIGNNFKLSMVNLGWADPVMTVVKSELSSKWE